MYADYISDAVLAEELGFSHTWYGEHHFRDCQWATRTRTDPCGCSPAR